jgi:hypothetical protein
MHVLKLADDLIEMRCGRYSLANVYEYLLNAYAYANRAKADFIRFLSGDLPRQMLEVVARIDFAGTRIRARGGELQWAGSHDRPKPCCGRSAPADPVSWLRTANLSRYRSSSESVARGCVPRCEPVQRVSVSSTASYPSSCARCHGGRSHESSSSMPLPRGRSAI